MTYKYLLVATVALNVLAATSGVVCSVYLWKGTFELSDKILSQTHLQKKYSELEGTIRNIQSFPKGKSLSRSEALREIQAWERLKLESEALGLVTANNFPVDYFLDPKSGEQWQRLLASEIADKKAVHSEEIHRLAQREAELKSAVLWIMALTLIFGVALPLIIFSLLLKALRTAQKALAETAKEIVHDWSVALQRYGEDPFKNAHFWIEALLIITEQVGSQSRHPAAQLSSELSHLVRTELHKTDNRAA